MTTEMQNIPTAQYYTTTDHTVARLIRLTAILSIIIGGAGLLQMAIALGALFMGDAQAWTSLRSNSAYLTINTLTNWLLFSPLKLLSGIGCLYQKEWARRGMVALAILTIISSSAFECFYYYQFISRQIFPFGPRANPFDQGMFALQRTIGFVAGLLLPLLMLILFRSESAKQFFKP